MNYFPPFVFIFFAFSLQSQAPIKPILCGNEIFSNVVHSAYPDLEEAFNLTFENAKFSSHQRLNALLTIKVVIHVIWKEPAENLHDSIILDQIKVLNEDYNRRNEDTSDLREIFRNDAASPNIHFELVEIRRVYTDRLFSVDLLGENLLAEVKHDAEGGSDAADPDLFMNIWIAKIQPIEIFGIPVGQILGFAFPPNGLDHWPAGTSAPTPGEDGVVLDYRIVGRNNPNKIEIPAGGGLLTVKGRSATHEIGHYLGLRHIWGDGNLLGPNDCQQTDGMDDTPYADSQSDFDCDKTKNSCLQVEEHYGQDMPDLIENYMDYAKDDCMNMFTGQQVALMRNVLAGTRNGLIENVTAVQHLNNKLDFRIVPNPTMDVSSVFFKVENKTEIIVRISDINGHLTLAKVRQEYLPGEHELSINFNGFSSGIYFIELRTIDGVSVRKIIVR